MGQAILHVLSADDTVGTVYCVGRRSPALSHPKVRFIAVDFSDLDSLPRADEVFIALGTTIKVAGSQAAFRAVDFDAVVTVARIAKLSGARRLGVVSAMGANPRSSVFYNRVKGEMEQAVIALGYDTVVIARPSLLEGDRGALRQPPRPAERLSLALMRTLRPLVPAALRAVSATDVARSLEEAVRTRGPGVHILPSNQLQRR